MSASTLAGLSSVSRESDDDPMEDARESLVATLAWMTATVAGTPNAMAAPGPPLAPAESWRMSAGTMTPSRAASGDAIQSDGRVVADLRTDALGTIRVIIQRLKTGLSVVIMLRETAAATVTEDQRAGLERALVAAGLSVSSVTFMCVGEDGTAFALHDQGSSEAPNGGATHIAAGQGSRARSSSPRKLNTLG
jgi:hypothetical protein